MTTSYIWVKSCRTGKKCSECLNFTLTQRVALSKPSILQTWVFYPVGYLCLGHLHKNFHLPGTIFKALKFKGKIIKNWTFWQHGFVSSSGMSSSLTSSSVSLNTISSVTMSVMCENRLSRVLVQFSLSWARILIVLYKSNKAVQSWVFYVLL